MAWTIETDTKNNLIVVSICEEVNVEKELYCDITEKIITYNKDLKFGILFIVMGARMDLTENEIVKLVNELHWKHNKQNMEDIKIAGVVSKNNQAGWKFVFLINRLLGRNAKLFNTRDQAVAWLIDPYGW